MAQYIISGRTRLEGSVVVSGSKNAALGIVAASLLSDDPCYLENVPDIDDIRVMIDMCRTIGAVVERREDGILFIDPRSINTCEVLDDNPRKIRGSYYLQGALLGRMNRVKIASPGGCNLGPRPTDIHNRGFESLGATVNVESGIVTLEAKDLTGGNCYVERSVGATINIMLGAVKARGTSTIENAAREPHVVDVASFLNSMGANIKGAGTDVIRITGVPYLGARNSHVEYAVIPDQIEAGTFMIAAALTHGDVIVRNVIPKHQEALTAKLQEMGVNVETNGDWVRVSRDEDKPLTSVNVNAVVYPGFPTDMQPQMTVLLTQGNGRSRMTENIYENRFQYLPDLISMGANIELSGRVANIYGPTRLSGNWVSAHDLRAGAAMVLAGMAAEGQTTVNDAHLIQRGYVDFIDKLNSIGAKISFRNDD
ncbi:MAG: UDP-N-acetylglucosamine 1-carboxyvinyltransferase [Clostridiaceae bacterium]|nr:UDP-N-acetylglucosamine 1-carboxyvinyltransferase [Clostridiaceae bacterium]